MPEAFDGVWSPATSFALAAVTALPSAPSWGQSLSKASRYERLVSLKLLSNCVRMSNSEQSEDASGLLRGLFKALRQASSDARASEDEAGSARGAPFAPIDRNFLRLSAGKAVR